jgi:protein MPE1
LFVDPMKTPCCGTTYCHDCIENALLENDLTCPGCETENVSLEALEPDEEMKEKIKAYQDEKSNDKQRSASPQAQENAPQAEEAKNGSRPASRDGSKSPKSEGGQSRKRTADEVDDAASSNLDVPEMKRQKSSDGTPAPEGGKEGSKPSTPTETTGEASTDGNKFPENMMPPDFSQMNMQNMGMNFPMGMPNMMMPFMNMPNMMGMAPNMNMMGMMGGMNGMNAMGSMPGMNGMNAMGSMPGMNGMNGMGPMNNMGMGMGMGMNQNQPHFPSGQQNNRGGGWNNKHHQFRNKPHNFNQPPQAPKQPEGLSNVPTGPKAMKNANQGPNQAGFYPPAGPAGGKFSNQQRYAGKEEDNAYLRQPVNPQRQWQRNKRGKPREADYREL